MAQETVGTIVSLFRYPVKSMMGEELNASEVTSDGLLGDRCFAVIDSSNGKVASAKNPVKWGKLFSCRAAYVEPPHAAEKLPPLRITLPDGSALRADSPGANEMLSRLFERQVHLAATAATSPVLEEYWPDIDGLAHRETVTDESIAAAAPAGSFFDYAVVHLLTTSTLDRLRTLYPEGRFESRRFRPNIVVQLQTNEKTFAENAWIGKDLVLGDHAKIHISDPCARCVMTTMAQGDLPQDHGILRTAAQHNKVIGGEAAGPDGAYAAVVGVYARVLNPGTIRRGDKVILQ